MKNDAADSAMMPDEFLAEMTARTVSHYERNAQAFFDGTRDHDVSQNIAALLDAIQQEPPFTLLDFGCGPGRDLKVFAGLGHRPIGLDGSGRFVEMARTFSACEVWHQDFLNLSLPAGYFDGVYANASLFHVPTQALLRVLGELRDCLRPGGVLFASNPRGDNQEGWNHDRYGAYYDLDVWRGFMTTAGFDELGHYFRPPGLPREQQPWLASVWRRV